MDVSETRYANQHDRDREAFIGCRRWIAGEFKVEVFGVFGAGVDLPALHGRTTCSCRVWSVGRRGWIRRRSRVVL